MIRKDSDHARASASFHRLRREIRNDCRRLAALGFERSHIKLLSRPRLSELRRLRQAIHRYEQLRLGPQIPPADLHGLGAWLIELRITRGVSQRMLARRLGVHESTVSRDERTHYASVGVERAARIVDALGLRIEVRAIVMDSGPTWPSTDDSPVRREDAAGSPT